jgi:hypothetical protein
VTQSVCPIVWRCHAVWPQGQKCTDATLIGSLERPWAIGSTWTSPVNQSDGPFIVGGLDWTSMVGSSTRSAEFRVLWARHNVSDHRTGRKHAHHPLVGDLTLSYEALDLPGDPGQTMLAYTAEPNTPSAERLCILASWTAPTTPSDVPGRDDADRTRKRRT